MKTFKYLVFVSMLLIFVNAYSQISFRELDYDSIPVSYTGKIVDAYDFKDKEGQHLLLITKIEASATQKTTIFAWKYTKYTGYYKKKWELKDVAEEIALHFPYTKVTDINNDGIYETIFVYQLNPDFGEGSDWKIMLHLKNKKYALRAHVPELDFDKYKVTMDKVFQSAPVEYKTYVRSYWERIVKEKGLKTQ